MRVFFPIRAFFSVFSDGDAFSGFCGFEGGFAYVEGFQAVDSRDHGGLVVEYGVDEVAEFHVEGFSVFYEGLVDSFVVLDAYLWFMYSMFMRPHVPVAIRFRTLRGVSQFVSMNADLLFL